MKKYFLILTLSPFFSLAQIDSGDRLKLMQLMEARKAKFGSYYTSINTRSGIFGNTTKKDLRRSNEILIQIAKTDNKIFEGLNNMLQARNYEKSGMNYEFNNQDQKIRYYTYLTDTLASQLDYYRAGNDEKSLKLKKYKIYNIVLSVFSLLLITLNMFIFYQWSKKKTL